MYSTFQEEEKHTSSGSKLKDARKREVFQEERPQPDRDGLLSHRVWDQSDENRLLTQIVLDS